MSDVPARATCTECGYEPDGEPPNFCPECGGYEWETEPKFDFERDIDLPFVFSVEHYDDNYRMMNEFCEAAFGLYKLDTDAIANCPALPRMKYCVVETYWKLTEDLKLEGPYLDEQEARE